jgi:hypothetical protein
MRIAALVLLGVLGCFATLGGVAQAEDRSPGQEAPDSADKNLAKDKAGDRNAHPAVRSHRKKASHTKKAHAKTRKAHAKSARKDGNAAMPEKPEPARKDAAPERQDHQ